MGRLEGCEGGVVGCVCCMDAGEWRGCLLLGLYAALEQEDAVVFVCVWWVACWYLHRRGREGLGLRRTDLLRV